MTGWEIRGVTANIKAPPKAMCPGSNHHSAIDSAAKAGSELVAVDNRFLALEAQIAELETKLSASVDDLAFWSQSLGARQGGRTLERRVSAF